MDRIDENDCRTLYKCVKNTVFTAFVSTENNKVDINKVEKFDLDSKCAKIIDKYQTKESQERMLKCVNFRGVLSNGEWIKIVKIVKNDSQKTENK